MAIFCEGSNILPSKVNEFTEAISESTELGECYKIK
jgi:hypothetical protein